MASQRKETKGEGSVSLMFPSSQQPSPNVSETLYASSSSISCDPIIPQSSDVTIQWNNKSPYSPESLKMSSPIPDNNRRRVFGHSTTTNYGLNKTNSSSHNINGCHDYKKSNYIHTNGVDMGESNCNLNGGSAWISEKSIPSSLNQDTSYLVIKSRGVEDSKGYNGGNLSDSVCHLDRDNTCGSENSAPHSFNDGSSDLTENNREAEQSNEDKGGGLTNSAIKRLNDQYKAESARDLLSPPPCSSHHHKSKSKYKRVHETLHAQCLMLGLAFMAAWIPQNCMAPNLSEMARDFGFDEAKRDIYLGANIALATGVLSLPIAAGIGILADFWNRKYLFCATVALGGFSSYLTGASLSYRALFLARLLNGSFMSGSVPIAFSMLGDLFETNERNAASSGLTSMMGLGIILGQVYAGVVGSREGWRHPFYVSCLFSLITASLVLFLVEEPIRGGKEEVLQNMLKHGARYERKLTWKGFVATMRNNKSNIILISYGFFSSIPWGIIFVFLNDYLSQERGFSVPDATYLVGVFGIGMGVGSSLGGYWGQLFQSWNTSYLPLFMSATTFLGTFPFVLLLNGHLSNAHNFLVITYSFLGGCLASMPNVCVRPCLINVNPPESRGATLTAANLVIQLARGAGPSCITLLGTIFNVDRQYSFNITLSVFWTVSAIQLLFLAEALPKDQDAMNAELAEYAANAIACEQLQPPRKISVRQISQNFDDEAEPISIMEHHIAAVDARGSMRFVGTAFKEIGDEISTMQPFHCKEQPFHCKEEASSSCYRESDDDLETQGTPDSNSSRKHFLPEHKDSHIWRGQLPEPDESTPLSRYYS